MSEPSDRRGRRRTERLLLLVAILVAIASAREAAFARNRSPNLLPPPDRADDAS